MRKRASFPEIEIADFTLRLGESHIMQEFSLEVGLSEPLASHVFLPHLTLPHSCSGSSPSSPTSYQLFPSINFWKVLKSNFSHQKFPGCKKVACRSSFLAPPGQNMNHTLSPFFFPTPLLLTMPGNCPGHPVHSSFMFVSGHFFCHPLCSLDNPCGRRLFLCSSPWIFSFQGLKGKNAFYQKVQRTWYADHKPKVSEGVIKSNSTWPKIWIWSSPLGKKQISPFFTSCIYHEPLPK